ncbi:hypothetical protein DSECCO2_608100 [anaerobic digester metagenome]
MLVIPFPKSQKQVARPGLGKYDVLLKLIVYGRQITGGMLKSATIAGRLKSTLKTPLLQLLELFVLDHAPAVVGKSSSPPQPAQTD